MNISPTVNTFSNIVHEMDFFLNFLAMGYKKIKVYIF